MCAWRWSQPTTTGKAPTVRAGAASGIQDGQLIILGGWDGKTAFTDAYALNLETLKWRSLSPRGDGTMELRIFFGRAVSPNGVLYVHGGAKPTNLNEMYHDVMSFDARTSVLRKVRVKGDDPGPIMRQSLAIMNGYMYSFGGFDGKKWTDTTHRLDLDAEDEGGARRGFAKWERLEVTGFAPYPRSFACLVAWPQPQPRLLLHGGGDGDTDFAASYVFRTQDLYWERLTNVSNATVALSQHGCDMVPASRAGGEMALALHGGYGGIRAEGRGESGERQHKLWLLRLGSTEWRWTEPRAVGQPKTKGRMGHAMHAVNSSLLVVWGGSIGEGGKHLNDVLFAVPNKVAGGEEQSSEMVAADEDDGHAPSWAPEPAGEAADEDEEDAWYEDERQPSQAQEAAPDTTPDTAPVTMRKRAGPDDAKRAGPDDAGALREEVVLRTVRTKDKKKAKKKKASRRKGMRTPKEEL